MNPKPLDEEALFQIVRRIDSAEERANFLAHACAQDPALAKRVNTLLNALEHNPEFMQPPIDATVTAQYAPPTEGAGTIIGPYKLLQRIGEGGFGIVYMAQQEKPVQRMVALKIIKPGMDTAQVIARFESERQALALMDHPNIAKVLDAGATEAGRPYFVMELVKGVPITEFCDKNHMPAANRLKLFIDVCHAIQHAHHKGVIHRDIKPSNVLVTLHDGVPVVKVIDFGVAKATAHRLTERTLFTAFGQMIGTPAYMSPEQAEMSGLDIDTRSDVYSLGVLLYELLTGTTPLETKRLRNAGYAEMQRLIREEEPPRPSTRLSSLGDSASIMAGNRGMDVKHLAKLLSGDLDWVVMKALDKDRNRRYATPGNFAEDIERYLRNEAIQARPPSTIYKLKKFVRRHRVATLAISAISTAILLGTILATWQAVRATHAEALARTERDRAEAGFQQARAAVDDYFTAVSENKLLDVPGLQPLRKDLLERALKYYQDFINQRGDDPAVRAELAATHYRVAMITSVIASKEQAARHFRDSLALYDEIIRERPDTERHRIDRAIVCNDLANLLGAMGHPDEALATHLQALQARETLAKRHPNEARYQNELAKSHGNIGTLQLDAGRPAEALASFKAARALNAPLVTALPAKLAKFPTDLGRSFNTTQAIQLDLAIDYRNMGAALYRMGRTSEASQAHNRSREILQGIVRDHPSELEPRSRLAHTLTTIAFQSGLQGHHDEALASLNQARAIVEALAKENPLVVTYQVQLARTHHELGRLKRRTGALAEARQHLEQSLLLQQKLAQDEPSNPGYAVSLAYVFRELSWVHRAQNEPELALQRLQQTRVIDEKQAETDVNAHYDLACDLALCIPLIGWNKSDEALTNQERAERERYATEAIKALRLASAGGWRNLEHWNQDEDLDAIRNHPDYLALVAEIAKPPLNQAPAPSQ